MHFILLSLLSIPVSEALKITNMLRAFKDMAKKGYKLDIDKWQEIEMAVTKNLRKPNHKLLLIPIYNLITTLKETFDYSEVKPYLFDLLSSIDATIPLESGEAKKFKDNPTMWRALIISLDNYVNSNSIIYEESVSIDTEQEQGELYYVTKNDIPIITRTTGTLSNLTRIEQQAKLRDYLLNLKESENSKMANYLFPDLGTSYTLKK